MRQGRSLSISLRQIEGEQDLFELRFPFDAGFKDQLKDALPSHGRGWDPDRRVWWIKPEFKETVLSFAPQYFARVNDNTKQYDYEGARRGEKEKRARQEEKWEQEHRDKQQRWEREQAAWEQSERARRGRREQERQRQRRKEWPPSQPPNTGKDSYWDYVSQVELTEEVLRKIHRIVMTVAHPDTGGNELLAKRLNASLDNVIKRAPKKKAKTS